MFEILFQYLIQNRSLSLPGLGTLHMQNIPAMSDFSNHVIAPPAEKVVFDSMLDTPHKSLFLYVANRLKVAEWEAIKMVNDFSFDLKHQLKDGKEIFWDGVGTFRSGDTGEIVLDAKPLQYEFVQPAAARRVVRMNAHHIIRRGDKEVKGSFLTNSEVESIVSEDSGKNRSWLIWAAIIAAIALLVLFIHFYRVGSSSAMLQNQQKITPKEAPQTYSTPQ